LCFLAFLLLFINDKNNHFKTHQFKLTFKFVAQFKIKAKFMALDKQYIQYDRRDLTNEQLKNIYLALIKPRLIEEKMLILLRQGKISKWFSGMGQEAISVGCTLAMDKDEYLFPMHRNLGVFTTRDIPMHRLFAQFQGKLMGFTKGRDRSFHFGAKEYHIVGMISHLGPQLALGDGVALANKLKKKKKATMAFTGDGGASEGDFHEALNVASVWDLPIIFTVENNQWGLSTPSREQFRCESFVDKGIGYGMDAMQMDGNNILEVYHTVKDIAESIRENPRPFLLEAVSYRMRGHEEASGTKYYPEGQQDEWAKKDPIDNYELYLKSEGVLSQNEIDAIRTKLIKDIQSELEIAYAEPKVEVNTDKEIGDVYAPYTPQVIKPKSEKKSEKRFIDAISDGLRLSMRKYDDLVIMGQDIAEYGGVFKITEGFVDEFGKERVRNTPICESAIVGVALGLSISGMKAVMEMQFADFVTVGFNQIVNNLAKLHYRWGENADVVIRMPTGGGSAAGPFHSQSNEAWFTHTPGLKVVYPSSPTEAKGLLIAAIEDPNPVMFFEHKGLYRSIKEEVYDDYYTIEIGKANVVKEGSKASVLTYGMGVHWAKEVVNKHQLDVEILDLRTLLPLDLEAIYNSVNKTGRVIILHEDCLTGGLGGELAALIAENCFENLDAPVMREGSLDTPVPFDEQLEINFMPKQRFENKLLKLINY
jgi:2-oxoisovalerate dehydrogenase E1 component